MTPQLPDRLDPAPSPTTDPKVLLLEGMTSSNNTTPPLISPVAGCTTFAELLVEHRRIAQTMKIDSHTVSYHGSQVRRFLKALDLDEMADPAFIADEAAFKIEVDKAIVRIGFNPQKSGGKCLRSALNRVRETYLLRLGPAPLRAASPESFRDFWSAYIHYGSIAFHFGYLGTYPDSSRHFKGKRRRPNGRLLQNHGIRQGTVFALKSGIPCVLQEFMRERFHAIEDLLHVTHGTLVRHLTFRGSRTVAPDRATDHSGRYSEAGRFRYGIKKLLWPEHLRAEVDEFFRLKTSGRWTTSITMLS